MDSVTAVKEVKCSGSSLAVYLTKELAAIDAHKGDKVQIIIEKADRAA